MTGAADFLDDALDEQGFCPGCGLAVDPDELWCGIDPACRVQALIEHGDDE